MFNLCALSSWLDYFLTEIDIGLCFSDPVQLFCDLRDSTKLGHCQVLSMHYIALTVWEPSPAALWSCWQRKSGLLSCSEYYAHRCLDWTIFLPGNNSGLCFSDPVPLLCYLGRPTTQNWIILMFSICTLLPRLEFFFFFTGNNSGL